MIKSIEIRDFRLFHNISFNLGRYLTVIGGKNAIGKSTLLGMIGNCVELKTYKPILHKNFRTEFSEIFKGSKKFDPTSSDKFIVNFCSPDFADITDYRTFRVAWQAKGTRFRVIPKRKFATGGQTEAKISWPTLYLGLGRLLPIGEADDEDIASDKLKLTDEEKEWFIRHYKSILSLTREELTAISHIEIKNTAKKGVGVSTTTYDYLANSAGQDNIGQILCSILSFKRLKESMGDRYTGGLLLIDEVDVTLHPYAQNNLIQVLIQQARELQLQIVCTTHSTSILEYICDKIVHNQPDPSINNNIELIYLTNENYKLDLIKNPTFDYIQNELYINSVVKNNRKIKVYVEDSEAKWFLEKLLSQYLNRIIIINSCLGDEELLRLNKLDKEYFSNVIIVVDGDTPQSEIDMSTPIRKNILKLPGNKRPESVFYDFIRNLKAEHDFLCFGRSYGFSLTYFDVRGPESSNYTGDERTKYKKWFNDHLEHFNLLNLYSYWESENLHEVEEFRENFIKIFNEICIFYHLRMVD